MNTAESGTSEVVAEMVFSALFDDGDGWVARYNEGDAFLEVDVYNSAWPHPKWRTFRVEIKEWARISGMPAEVTS